MSEFYANDTVTTAAKKTKTEPETTSILKAESSGGGGGGAMATGLAAPSALTGGSPLSRSLATFSGDGGSGGVALKPIRTGKEAGP